MSWSKLAGVLTPFVRILLVFGLSLVAPLSSPGPRVEASLPGERTATRQRIKAALFVSDPVPLEVEQYGQFEPAGGVVAGRVRYATDYGLRVPAIGYRFKDVPASKVSKKPGVVVVSGHGGDKYSWYSFYAGIAYETWVRNARARLTR